MRILVWNLERGRTKSRVVQLQQEVIAAAGADIAVLTELPAALSVPDSGRVVSPVERMGRGGPEAWVGIVARGVQAVDPATPYERMSLVALAEVDGEQVVVYGSVVPWMHAIDQAPYLARDGESSDDLFDRVLAEQVADVARLHTAFPDHTVVWAGDFNQPISGSNSGFSDRRRARLVEALGTLGLHAWNHESPHAKPGAHAIDLVCGTRVRPMLSVEVVEPVIDGEKLSDHAGYVVTI